RRPVEHLALVEQALIGLVRRNRHVLLFADGVAKAQVDVLDTLVFDQFKNIRRSGHRVSLRFELLIWSEPSSDFVHHRRGCTGGSGSIGRMFHGCVVQVPAPNWVVPQIPATSYVTVW